MTEAGESAKAVLICMSRIVEIFKKSMFTKMLLSLRICAFVFYRPPQTQPRAAKKTPGKIKSAVVAETNFRRGRGEKNASNTGAKMPRFSLQVKGRE